VKIANKCFALAAVRKKLLVERDMKGGDWERRSILGTEDGEPVKGGG
jgi:hypothetical protein